MADVFKNQRLRARLNQDIPDPRTEEEKSFGRAFIKEEVPKIEPVETMTQPVKAQADIPSPTQAQERSAEKQAIQKFNKDITGTVNNPVSFNKNYQKLMNIDYTDFLDKDQISDIDARRAELDNELQLAREQYNKDKNLSKWSAVAERAAQALTQLGAGLYGLKHNVNLAGLRFDKTDWDKSLDRSLRELREARLAQVPEREALGVKQKDLIKRALGEAGTRQQLVQRAYLADLKAHNDLVKARETARLAGDKAAQKRADKRLEASQKEARKNFDIYNKAFGSLQDAVENNDEEKVKKILDKVGGEAKSEIIKSSMEPGLLWGENLNLDTVLDEVKNKINIFKARILGKPVPVRQVPSGTTDAGLSADELKELQELEKLEAEGKL